MKIKPWIEAMRLRTLPVSIAGVLAAWGISLAYGSFAWQPGVICLLFAVVSQIVSNFANEYFDYVNGLDRPGREGFRRGVAEGDIKPHVMKRATFLLLAIDACLGLSLLYWGSLWLIPVGLLIFIGAIAYSGGPWPLSHHGLGDLAVIIFYGIIPVMLTTFLQASAVGLPFDLSLPAAPAAVSSFNAPELWLASLSVGFATGLMGSNVLIVNNYRDEADDRANGKRTTVVIFGKKRMAAAYLIFWLTGDILLLLPFLSFIPLTIAVGMILVFALLQYSLWVFLSTNSGAALNGLLRRTALLMLLEIGVLILIISLLAPAMN